VRRGERRPHLLGDGAGGLLEGVQEHANGGDRLSDVVVELAGDPLALGFQRLQHALREGLAGRLELLPFADVAEDPNMYAVPSMSMRATLISIGMIVPSLQRLMVSNGAPGPCWRPATNSASTAGGKSGLRSDTAIVSSSSRV